MKLFQIVCLLCVVCVASAKPVGLVVLQTDFGLKDGAVATMHGVALGVSRNLVVTDLTHEIPPFDIAQAGYRLWQTAPYWPKGTVFVSVVDPGVGTARRSIVARINDQYFVTPDNGTLTTLVAEMGLEDVRVIDERVHRRSGSEDSHTFHGRDVYVYVAAKLASGSLRFKDVGVSLRRDELVLLDAPVATVEGDRVMGAITVLDDRYGNVWSNITPEDYARAGISADKHVGVRILNSDHVVWSGVVPFVGTFADVPEGEPLLYLNSLGRVALALNMGNFAETHGIGSGGQWRMELTAAP